MGDSNSRPCRFAPQEGGFPLPDIVLPPIRNTRGRYLPLHPFAGREIKKSPWGDSNSRPAHYECAALPLSYTGATLWGNSLLLFIHTNGLCNRESVKVSCGRDCIGTHIFCIKQFSNLHPRQKTKRVLTVIGIR